MKKIIFLLFLISLSASAQQKKYILLSEDIYKRKIYYSIDKKTEDGFYSWIKIENTKEQDPSTESTELFVEFKCGDETMSDEILIINWRGQNAEIFNEKSPFSEIPQNHPSKKLIEKFCKK